MDQASRVRGSVGRKRLNPEDSKAAKAKAAESFNRRVTQDQLDLIRVLELITGLHGKQATLSHIDLMSGVHAGILSRFLRRQRILMPKTCQNLHNYLSQYFYCDKTPRMESKRIVLTPLAFADFGDENEARKSRVLGVMMPGIDENKF